MWKGAIPTRFSSLVNERTSNSPRAKCLDQAISQAGDWKGVVSRHRPQAHSQEGQHFLVCNKTGDALLWSRMTRRSNLDGRSTTIMVLGVGAFAHSTTQILKEDGAKVLTYLTRDYGHFGASLIGRT